MVLDILAQGVMSANAFVFLGAVVLFSVVAFRFFVFFVRMVAVGLVCASFPFIAAFAGLGVPLTLTSVIVCFLGGVTLFVIYGTLSGISKASAHVRSKVAKKKPSKKEE